MQSIIDPSNFDDIISDLERQPLQRNEYRDKAGAGRSQAFGVVGRRSLGPDYSRQCWLRPKLYHLLLDFGQKFVKIPFNAITVNQNYAAAKHRDKNNRGDSFLVGFGPYKGGDLKIYEGDLSGNHDIRYRPLVLDFSKVYHAVEPFQGDRYSLVYYWFQNSRSVPLPPPSVRLEGGLYKFYRGEEYISKKIGLPHPLRKKIPYLKKEEKEVIMDFE